MLLTLNNAIVYYPIMLFVVDFICDIKTIFFVFLFYFFVIEYNHEFDEDILY